MIWVLQALAQRPDQGGLYSFDAEDQLDYVDGPAGLVRVTYSVAGPNETVLDDDDEDGKPDFPQSVAENAEAVLAMYTDLGFRSPISETEWGNELGGSSAFDFYLVDFNLTADGMFATDACVGQQCSGYMIMENDFKGYGYPSRELAIQTLTSHELFHAVQAAYRSGQEVWVSEGTATWGEHQYNDENTDFFSLCNAYLEDPGRTLDNPPAGPVPAFAYGTALFWQFLTERYGTDAVVLMMEAEDDTDGLEALESVLADLGTSWDVEWPVFASWNLATGSNAGVIETYPFAEKLQPVLEEGEGYALVDDNRFYPLATTYYTLNHPGGKVYFTTPDDPSGLVFGLHPVEEAGVGEAVAGWAPTAPGQVELGEFPAGEYRFYGTYPVNAEESNKILFCLGDEATMAYCAEPADSAADSEDTGTKPEPKECGCNAGGGGMVWLLGVAGVLGSRRAYR